MSYKNPPNKPDPILLESLTDEQKAVPQCRFDIRFIFQGYLTCDWVLAKENYGNKFYQCKKCFDRKVVERPQVRGISFAPPGHTQWLNGGAWDDNVPTTNKPMSAIYPPTPQNVQVILREGKAAKKSKAKPPPK